MLTPTDRSAFNVAEALEILSEDWAVPDTEATIPSF